MDRSSVCYLVTKTFVKDEYGVDRPTETQTKHYCNVQSVSANEFFSGGEIGLKPDLRFTMPSFEYSDEEIVVYENKRYKVYRTYHGRNDTIELYTTKEI